jgi:hypothetical protein
MPEGSQPAYEIALAHFIVSDDVERSRRFWRCRVKRFPRPPYPPLDAASERT